MLREALETHHGRVEVEHLREVRRDLTISPIESRVRSCIFAGFPGSGHVETRLQRLFPSSKQAVVSAFRAVFGPAGPSHLGLSGPHG